VQLAYKREKIWLRGQFKDNFKLRLSLTIRWLDAIVYKYQNGLYFTRKFINRNCGAYSGHACDRQKPMILNKEEVGIEKEQK
jgi:hypothetical protein